MKYLVLMLLAMSLVLVGCPHKKPVASDEQSKLEEPKDVAAPEVAKPAPVPAPATEAKAVAPAAATPTAPAVAPAAQPVPVKVEPAKTEPAKPTDQKK